MKMWKQRVYDSYMSNGFQDTHSMKKEFTISKKYFKKNYLRFMPMDKTAKVLELGCGMGQFFSFCKSEGYHNYEGIDASKENVAFMRKMFGRKIEVSVNDIISYLSKKTENQYDAVIFNDVIEHLTKSEIFEVLEGIYRVLQKDGVLLIKTPNMANPFVNTAGRYIDITHEVGFTEKSMVQVLRAAGFKNIKVTGTDIYVFNPMISVIAKLISKMINAFLFLLSALYGRTSLRIFEKDILAAAYKK